MDPRVREVIDEIKQNADAIKMDCPPEVTRLFVDHVMPSEQGALWNQVFTDMVHAEGDCRQVKVSMLFVQQRLCDRDIFDLDQLRMLFRETVPISAEFLATLGYETIWKLVKKVLAILDLVDNKQDYKELLGTLATYVSNLHCWTIFYFPWYCGDFFPINRQENLESLRKSLEMPTDYRSRREYSGM